MSRYADRRAYPPPAPARPPRPVRDYYDDGYSNDGYFDDRRSNGRPSGRERGTYPPEDEDTVVSTVVSTAVGTDLSNIAPSGRAVSFGANEVEEFNVSEAPDAIIPARSRNEDRTPRPPSVPPAQSSTLAVPIASARSRAISPDNRRSPASLAMPPPPVPVHRQQVPPIRPSYYPAPPAQDWRHDYRDYRQQDDRLYSPLDDPEGTLDDGDDDDDDDAFTAVGTGVATDLSFDEQYPNGVQRVPRDRYDGPNFPTMRESPAGFRRSALPSPPPPHLTRNVSQYPPVTSASGYDSSYFRGPDDRDAPFFSNRASTASPANRRTQPPQLAPPPTGIQRPMSSGSVRDMQVDDDRSYDGAIRRQKTPGQPPPAEPRIEDSPVEKELIALLKELQFSLALKDFHDTMKIGVERTLVSEDGRGHAYCKVHCKKLPKHEDIARERHLRNHWVPIAGSRWEFRTASHSVTVVFKTAALAAYEAQFLTNRR
ncbi:hypothetical protein JCM10212_003370 [Sporobolomyces blumeae]